MEKLTLRTNTTNLSLPLLNTCNVLVHYNQLTSYPLSDIQIVDWANSLKELFPEMTDEVLKSLINGLKLGVYNFNDRVGIQNITLAYKVYVLNQINSLNSAHKNWDSVSEEQIEKERATEEKIAELRKIVSKFINVTIQGGL